MNGQTIQKKQQVNKKYLVQKRNKLKRRVSGQIEYFSAAWRKQIKQ